MCNRAAVALERLVRALKSCAPGIELAPSAKRGVFTRRRPHAKDPSHCAWGQFGPCLAISVVQAGEVGARHPPGPPLGKGGKSSAAKLATRDLTTSYNGRKMAATIAGSMLAQARP